MITTLRVDERLIHGQVVTNWIRFLGLTNLIVANDAAAQDELQKGVLKMACPPGVKCMVATVDKAIRTLQDPRAEKLKIMVITENPRDALKLVEAVPEIPDVNVSNFGNMCYKEDNPKTQLCANVRAEQEDLEAIRELTKRLPVYSQILPTKGKTKFTNV